MAETLNKPATRVLRVGLLSAVRAIVIARLVVVTLVGLSLPVGEAAAKCKDYLCVKVKNKPGPLYIWGTRSDRIHYEVLLGTRPEGEVKVHLFLRDRSLTKGLSAKTAPMLKWDLSLTKTKTRIGEKRYLYELLKKTHGQKLAPFTSGKFSLVAATADKEFRAKRSVVIKVIRQR